jgi:hypothetical protein
VKYSLISKVNNDIGVDETVPRQSTLFTISSKFPCKVKAILYSKFSWFLLTRLLLGLYDYRSGWKKKIMMLSQYYKTMAFRRVRVEDNSFSTGE